MSNEDLKYVTTAAKVCLASSGDIEKYKDAGPFRVETTYINYTPTDISIVMRNDVRVRIPSKANLNHTGFIIREKYVFHSSCINDMVRLFKTNESDLSTELQCMLPKFIEVSGYRHSHHVEFVLDTTISTETLKESNGTFYSINKDLIVSMLDLWDAPMHPYSEKSTFNLKFKDIANLNDGLSFFIEIVDNANQITPKLFNLAETIYEVKPITDASRSSGVYLSIAKLDIHGEKQIKMVRYDLSDAEKLIGLYSTREEAIAHGDIAGANKLKIAELDHGAAMRQDSNKAKILELEMTAKEQTHAYQVAELKYKQELQQVERELSGLKTAYENSKMLAEINKVREIENISRRSYEQKDYYEARSYERKDTSEFFKVIPTVLTAAAAIGAWFVFS